MAIDDGPGGDDAEHVSFVNELLGDLLEQVADAAGVAEVEVQVVDEDEEDAAGRVRWPAATAGSRMPSATGAGGGAAML